MRDNSLFVIFTQVGRRIRFMDVVKVFALRTMGRCSSRNLFPKEDCRDLVVALFTSSYRT